MIDYGVGVEAEKITSRDDVTKPELKSRVCENHIRVDMIEEKINGLEDTARRALHKEGHWGKKNQEQGRHS